MRVYISADMEGISGLVSWSQCGRPTSSYYDFAYARERITADVNAAIRGARAAGATEILVKDSHGNSKNILANDLEPGASLVSGCGSTLSGMMAGVDRSFACAILVGYHAMAGTPSAIMEHTITGGVHRMWINDMPAGEIAMAAGMAGCFDVPIVMISSDRAGCAEASALLPGIETAIVKDGFGRFMGQCLHPSESSELIQAAAEAGVHRASALDPWLPETPCTVKIEFNRTEYADTAGQLISCRRTDGYTVESTHDSWATAHQATWQMIMYAIMGNESDK